MTAPASDASPHQVALHVGLDVAVITDLLGRGHTVRFRVAGTSMLPTIFPGECLVVGPASAADLRRGDLALYRMRERLIAHRVVGLWTENDALRVVFRGDNQDCCDPTVEGAAVIGRVNAIEGLWRRGLWGMGYV